MSICNYNGSAKDSVNSTLNNNNKEVIKHIKHLLAEYPEQLAHFNALIKLYKVPNYELQYWIHSNLPSVRRSYLFECHNELIITFHFYNRTKHELSFKF